MTTRLWKDLEKKEERREEMLFAQNISLLKNKGMGGAALLQAWHPA